MPVAGLPIGIQRPVALLAAVASLLAAAAAPAAAEDLEPLQLSQGWHVGDELLNLPDWLNLEVTFTAEPMADPLGGESRLASWLGQTTASLRIGSGLARAPDQWRELDHWSLNATLTHTAGDGQFAQAIGALIPVQQIAYPNGFLLTEASISRSSGSGWLTLKGGILPMDPDFIAAPVLGFYVHSAFNDTLNLSLNGAPIIPYAALGGLVHLQAGPELSLRYGWFDLSSTLPIATWLGSPDPFKALPGGNAQLLQLNWTPSGLAPATGTPLPACRVAGGVVRRRGPCSKPLAVQNQLPGALLSLGGYTTSRQSGGVYGSATLRSGLPLGLDERVWVGGAWAPDASASLAPTFLAAGLVVQGPLPSRPLDVLVLGAGRAGLNPTQPLGWPTHYEGMVELGYQLRLSGNLALQPTVQWILNPSGAGGPVPDILTAGLQISLSF
ncbi:MAG: carbohydrate porin [Vulcanococcus sp.]